MRESTQGAGDGVMQNAPETLNIESLGFALAITWFAMILWSSVAVPASFSDHASDFMMHLLRLSVLGVVCIVYLIVQFFPFIIQKKVVKYVAMAIGVALSPLPLLGNVCPWFASVSINCQPILVLSWMLSGFSVAVMMLVWGYGMSTKVNYRQGIVNVSASSMLSGSVFILCAFLERAAASMLIMLMPFVMLVVWIVCLRQGIDDSSSVVDFEHVANPTALTSMRLVLGKGATIFIFSYGFIMGVSGSVGTQFDLSQYSFVFVGVATLSAGVVMCIMLRSGVLVIQRSIFMWFLPFAVVCLFLLSVADNVGKTVLLFAVFFVVNSYNVINTAYVGDGGSGQLNQMRDMFSCESRSADMLGSMIGWAAGTLIQFVVDDQLVPYCYFLIAAALVGVAVASFVREEERPTKAVDFDKKEAIGSVLAEWEAVCSRLSEQYKFSARESEIFLLLSRGRDRQYIHNLLYIAPSTVRTHTYNIYQKMGVHNQQELIDVVENEFVNR